MSENSTLQHTDELLRHVVASANVHAGDSVLDVGTGSGIMLPYLADAVGRFGLIDAVDISGEMLAQAHAKYASLPLAVRFLLADIETDTIHTLYDRILLLDIMPHLSRPLETLLKLFTKNLNGGGTISLVQLGGRDMFNARAAEGGNAIHPLPPASQMASRLADAGLKVDYVEDSREAYIIRVRRH